MRSVIRWIILVVVVLGLGSAIVWALLPQPVPVDVAAVVKTYRGEVNIKGKSYHEILVQFEEEGGGE